MTAQNHPPQQHRDHNRERHYGPGEIDFTEQARSGCEGVGGGPQAVGEVVPGGYSSQIEQNGRYSIGREAGHATEDDGHDCRLKNGLDKEPQWPQDCLFVFRHKVAADKQHEQVAVSPYFPESQIKEIILRRYGIRVCFVFNYHLRSGTRLIQNCWNALLYVDKGMVVTAEGAQSGITDGVDYFD